MDESEEPPVFRRRRDREDDLGLVSCLPWLIVVGLVLFAIAVWWVW